jgi:hypothetical protein
MYYHRTLGADHWSMLVKMIDENYALEENPDTVLILGLYQLHTAKQIREMLNIQPHVKMIAYQLEPLIDKHISPPFTLDKMIDQIRGYDEVWDYDLENIEILRKHGIEAKFKPPAYTQSLNVIPNNDNPDIDILFYGSPTFDRGNFFVDLTQGYIHHDELSSLTFSKMNIVTLYNIQDSRLDDFISRSKIILNLCPSLKQTRQQQTRIFYPLINRKCVLSQKCPINYFGDCIVEFDGFQDFGDKALQLLQSGDWKDYPTRTESYQKFVNRETIYKE